MPKQHNPPIPVAIVFANKTSEYPKNESKMMNFKIIKREADNPKTRRLSALIQKPIYTHIKPNTNPTRLMNGDIKERSNNLKTENQNNKNPSSPHIHILFLKNLTTTQLCKYRRAEENIKRIKTKKVQVKKIE